MEHFNISDYLVNLDFLSSPRKFLSAAKNKSEKIGWALRNLPTALKKNCTLGILKSSLRLFCYKNIFALWQHVKNESDIADEAFFHLHDINTDGFIDKQELRWVFSYLLPNNYLLEL